jgi:hypothetical protein
MFYAFSQNNSGGRFVLDEECGLTHFVLIEADSASDANYRAIAVGIYFDGCREGLDCACCGDRWGEVDDRDATESPTIYEQPADQYTPFIGRGWMPEGKEICIHFKDGRKQWHGIAKAAQ